MCKIDQAVIYRVDSQVVVVYFRPGGWKKNGIHAQVTPKYR